jgi:hypothetical protein
MPNFTEKVTVFEPSVTIDDTLNVIPNALTSAGMLGCNIHRGTQSSKDDAAVIGVFNTLTADAFFPVSAAPLLSLRSVLKDGSGTFWIVRAVWTRNRFPQTAHTRCLLVLLNAAPDGAS